MDLREKYKGTECDFESIRKEKIKIFKGDIECLDLPGCIICRLNFEGIIFRTMITADTIYVKAKNEIITNKLVESCNNVEWIEFDKISRVNKDSPIFGKTLRLYTGDFAAEKKKHPRLSKNFKQKTISFEGHYFFVYIHSVSNGFVYISKSLIKEPWFSITIFMKENGIQKKLKKSVDCANLFTSCTKKRKGKAMEKTEMWGPKSNARGYKIPGARGGVKLWS